MEEQNEIKSAEWRKNNLSNKHNRILNNMDTEQKKESCKEDIMRLMISDYEGNWTEDFSHENGNYMNMCIRCDQEFLGHKRRIICKKCFTISPNI